MLNDHQPLPGDLNDVQWSDEDIANVIAALKSGQASREVRTQSDYTTTTFPQGQYGPLQTGSSGSTSIAFVNYDCTTFTKR